MRIAAMLVSLVVTWGATTGTVLAAEDAATAPHGAAGPDEHHAVDPPYAHPTPPEPSAWPGVLVLLIGGMFLAAAVIGPIVRSMLDEEPPAPSSHDHDDPHAADHGHGHH
jgi:hypothetical protein